MGMTTAEFTKLVESGQLLSGDFLPKFGKALREAANGAGALEQKMKTTRVAQGRFFKQLETAQDKIFTSGMDAGGGSMFNDMADAISRAEMGLKGLGQIFNVVFKTIGGAVALVMPIISDVAVVLGAIASNLDAVFGTGAGKIILGISAVRLAVWKLNDAAAATAAKFALVFGALNEIIALFTTGYIGTAELALGKDINLSKLPIISDIVGFAQGDGFWSKALSFLGQAVLLLAAIRGILWSIGVKFGVTDMAKSIKKATDKVRGTSSSSGNTKQTSFDFKERRSFKFGEWVDKTVKSGFSGLAGIGRKFLTPQSMAFSSEKEALEYMRQNRLGGEGKNVTVENVTIDVKSDNPEEVATRIREFWDREIMNNYAN